MSEFNGWSIFMPLLTVCFIGLKLAGYITWSWWWVLSPIWGALVLMVVIAFINAVIEVWDR